MLRLFSCTWNLQDPFCQSCKQDAATFPRPASRGDSGGASGARDHGLTSKGEFDPNTATVMDVDCSFRDKRTSKR